MCIEALNTFCETRNGFKDVQFPLQPSCKCNETDRKNSLYGGGGEGADCVLW